MCLLYHHTISYINAETNINEKLVELEVASVCDFSVQGKITPKVWADFTVNQF